MHVNEKQYYSETFSVDVKIPETAVPAKETTYICMNFELPNNQENHIVATTPLIDNINIMHHILAYECGGKNINYIFESDACEVTFNET